MHARAHGTADTLDAQPGNDDSTAFLIRSIHVGLTRLTELLLLSNGILVFFMQCGFGMLEAGSVTARATQNILLKNLLERIDEEKRFQMTEARLHFSIASPCSSHCLKLGLSAFNDSRFFSPCDHPRLDCSTVLPP